jgi:hypothetical protein
MGMGALILKKAAKYASLKMLMDISEKDHIGICRSIMFYMIDEVEELNFLRKGGVTYATTYKVTLIM